MSAAASTAGRELAPVEYKPAFAIAVCGSGDAPPELVARVLDQVFAPHEHSHYPLVVGGGGEEPATVWAHARPRGSVTCEFVCRELYGRSAYARWAMSVASIARALVIFGDDRRWWRLLRLAGELGIPVRRVPIPAGYTAPHERPERPVPAAIVPAANPWAVLDGAGPGGYPD